jgi:hypothetical protein
MQIHSPRPTRAFIPWSAALIALLSTFPAFAQPDHKHHHHHHAHVHGVAKLEVAVEGGHLSLHLETPLEGVLGFEHAPRNDKERATASQMRKTLTDAGKLFLPTTAAQCALKSVQIEAPTLDAKSTKGKDQHADLHSDQHADQHSDLNADFVFSCAQPNKLTGMDVRLFQAFPKMRRIDAQVVSGKGQKATRLSSKMRFLSW